MASLTDSPAWRALAVHHRQIAALHMRDLFAEDAGRFNRFSISFGDLLFDYSKNRITAETIDLLTGLASQADVAGWRARMVAGDAVNTTEDRAALHTALRDSSGRDPSGCDSSGTSARVDGEDVAPRIAASLAAMRQFSDGVRDGSWTGATGKPITDVVHIGIGGSSLGPAMVTAALESYQKADLSVHFVSNVDGAHLAGTLDRLNPATTLFLVASKSFTTEETLTNAASAKAWLIDSLGAEAAGRHLVALTANREAAVAFGIGPDNIFTFWEWVGGRYSLWSVCGLAVAIAVGMDRFEELLAGAHAMDRHFMESPLKANMPVIMALLGIWYGGFFGTRAQAVLPYDQSLALFPAYIQQLEMESNGKGVTRDGAVVDVPTAPVVFGTPGTDGQHAFHQVLHQGPDMVPADFIAAAESHRPLGDHHAVLLANFLAQSEALMIGRDAPGAGSAHRKFPGNRPSNSILVRRFDPHTLGMLIALYEHKVFVQGIIWEINSFDQWGVELGKELAAALRPALQGASTPEDHDSSTNGLIGHYRELVGKKP